MKQVAQGAARITSKVASNLVSQKIEFVKGMLTSPLQTLRKEYLEPLQAAGTLLGKACYLACTDPERLKNGAVNRFNQTVKAAKNDPEAFMVAAGELLGGKTLKGITKIQNLQKVANAAGRGNQFAKVVTTTGKKAAEIKQAIAEPLKVITYTIVEWTSHGRKHFPQKVLSWKDVIKSTVKPYAARYKHGLNIEHLEREAWLTGIPVINGKTWKVKKYNDII